MSETAAVAKLIFEMNVSLDGYVDHTEMPTARDLYDHWVDRLAGLTGSVYGRRMYEAMRYWDEEHAEWGPDQQKFAQVWRKQPKWVVSRTLTSVGPNARLVEGDLGAFLRQLKAEHEGEIVVAGPELAGSVTELGLIDEYRLYLHPAVLGKGKPFFAAARQPLRLVGMDRMAPDVLRLCYVPA